VGREIRVVIIKYLKNLIYITMIFSQGEKIMGNIRNIMTIIEPQPLFNVEKILTVSVKNWRFENDKCH